jgi:putative CRISPR-associated protein (TIGR02619 family)
MNHLLLTTCGTSLLTGGFISDDLRKLITKSANIRTWDTFCESDKIILQNHINERVHQLLVGDNTTAKKMSAELNGFLTWQEHEKKSSKNKFYQQQHILLATDTLLGKTTADAIQQKLQQYEIYAEVKSFSGLNTEKLQDFRQALSELSQFLHERLIALKEQGFFISFNLTGGFKSINGFLQTAAMLYADESFYLFEGSSQLMRIPQLPIKLEDESIFRKYIGTFRKMEIGLPIDDSEISAIPDIFLFKIDRNYMLSEWGELLWSNFKTKFYKEKIWPSFCTEVIYLSEFENSLKDYPTTLYPLVNRAIDNLAMYIQSEGKKNLKSLDFKVIKGSQHGGRWECDLDGNHRLFTQAPTRYVAIEKLGLALHKSKSSI